MAPLFLDIVRASRKPWKLCGARAETIVFCVVTVVTLNKKVYMYIFVFFSFDSTVSMYSVDSFRNRSLTVSTVTMVGVIAYVVSHGMRTST